jgi:hypothetical protein
MMTAHAPLLASLALVPALVAQHPLAGSNLLSGWHPLVGQNQQAGQTPSSGQNQPSGAAITEKLDTPQARVIVATLQSHVPARSPNGHATHRVLIYMDDGVMTRQEGSSKPETITFHRGDVRWRPASGAYVAENTSDHPIRILEIDLKGAPPAPTRTTKLDATVVDPARYKVIFENDQVRVLRIHFGAHERGAEHEHILNRVVFYLNDQANAKRDDVRLAGAATHTEQNEGDGPADRIAVELK